MATISSLGSGSGLDLESLVTKLMSAEQAPLTQLATKEAKIQATITSLGSLKSALSTFQTSVKTLTDASKFMQATASSSDKDVIGVTAGANAQTGSYSLEVSQLALSHRIKSSATFAANTDAVGSGKITVQFGTYSSSGTFTANASKASTTITIDSSKNTLVGVRDAINAAGAGVKASIVNDGTGNRLVLTSSDTGVANSMKITISDNDGDNSDASGLSQLAYDASTGGTKNMADVQTAKDAQFTLDGMSITKSSNTVTDVISGVTLSLKTKTESPETITVARDTNSVVQSVQDFVKAYNTLTSSMKEMGSYTYNSATKTGTAGPLQGENSLRSAQSQLRSVLSGVLAGGTYTRLSQVGITFQKDGTLALDSTKLSTALESNYADVASLFSANGVPTDSGISFKSAAETTQSGNYTVNITQLATKGVLNGNAVTVPVTIDADSDALKLKIDGVQSGSIAITQKTYTSGADLATELQTKINGDSALKGAGVSVSVAWNSTANRLEITSAKYGASSTVEVTSRDNGVDAKLGLVVGKGTAGLDVDGIIGGTVTRGYLNSSAITAPVTIDADNNDLKFKIDGVDSSTITLSSGSYTGAQLATELQTKINADSALKSANISVAVAWNSNTNKVEITSNRYGNESKVAISSLDTNMTSTLGLSIGEGVAGTAVGGSAATGNGQVLTVSEGSGTGLKLTVQGDTTGYRGTIAFNRGFAYQLDKVLDSMLSSAGTIATRVNGLNTSVKTIDSQMERLQTRLKSAEQRYRAQFTALDTNIATMKSTSNYLTQQLASLISSTSSS